MLPSSALFMVASFPFNSHQIKKEIKEVTTHLQAYTIEKGQWSSAIIKDLSE
jgi:hypothetical protein